MISTQLINRFSHIRSVCAVRYYSRKQNPFEKTIKILSNDMPSVVGSKRNDLGTYPEHADIVVIGGGFIGSAVAYWLKSRAGEGLSVVVIEKDFSYKDVPANVSLGSITKHFSLHENIELSKHTVDFLRNVKETLNKDVNIQYTPTSSLVLASEKYANKLEKNVAVLQEHGVRNNLMTRREIKKKFPWINTEDVKIGCMALEGEGTFNSWALLKGLIEKSKELGAVYVNAEVTGFELEKQKDVLMEGVAPGTYERINKVVYKSGDDEEHAVKFAICVLAAGDNSGEIAKMAKIGVGDDILNVPLPIEKRQFTVYSIEGKGSETGLLTPMVSDTTGLCLWRNALQDNLLFAIQPLIMNDTKDMSDSDYFENIAKPSILNRIPTCWNAKIKKYSTEMYDCNVYDNSGILGPHPYHNNLFFATGFGKQGCSLAPGIGRAISELVIDSQFTTIDLTRLTFDRLLVNEPLVEFNVY